jgi:hypothetical protein
MQADARIPLRLRRKPSQADADTEHGQQENRQQKKDNCDMAEPPPTTGSPYQKIESRLSLPKKKRPVKSALSLLRATGEYRLKILP